MTLGIKHLYLRQLSLKNKNKINLCENIVTKEDKIISFDLENLDSNNNKQNDIKIKNKIYINEIKFQNNKLYLLE